LLSEYPHLVALDPPGGVWTPLGRGAILLPQSAETDGMYLLRLQMPQSTEAEGTSL